MEQLLQRQITQKFESIISTTDYFENFDGSVGMNHPWDFSLSDADVKKIQELGAAGIADFFQEDVVNSFSLSITFQFSGPYGRSVLCSIGQATPIVISSDWDSAQ